MTELLTRPPGAGWTTLHAHVHDAEVADRMVSEVVGPLGRRLRADGRAGDQFFLRYWEGGPHLRWRLRDVDPAVLAETADELTAWLAANPPSRELDPGSFLAGVGQREQQQQRWHAHGEVVQQPYLPEVDRYGGPQALVLAEQLFAASSAVAEVVLRGTATGSAQRRAVALDLLHAMVAGSGAEDAEAVRFLRGFVLGWPLAHGAPPVDLDAARSAAEADLLAAPAAHLDRRRVVAERVAAGSGVVAAWAGAVGRCVTGLRDLDAAGELAAPLPWVLGSQLHMLHNRLGLTVAEECHLAWLASSTYLGVDQTGGVHPQAGDQPDVDYHERSKFFPARGSAQFPDPDAPLQRGAVRPGVTAVPLPAVEAGPAGDVGLLDALLHRRSAYGRYAGTVSAADLGRLLWFAAGDVAELVPPGAGPEHRYPVRPYPSAGARAGTRLLVVCTSVDGVPAGGYEYRPADHALEPLPSPVAVPDLLRCSPFTDPTGEPSVLAQDAPFWLAVVADLAYPRQRYGLRSYRFQLLEAGHATQNLLLVGAALGLRSVPLGGVYDDRLAMALGLDGVDAAPLYLVPFGTDGWDGGSAS